MSNGPSELHNIISNVENIREMASEYIEIIKKYHGNEANAFYFIDAGLKILYVKSIMEKTLNQLKLTNNEQ